jgi:serine/threonine protein kinase
VLSFLGIVQSLKIDFLPITWQPALDVIGQGGTAEIRQAMVNLQMSFAFKRLASTERVQSERGDARIFRAFIAEMSVLSHPSVRDHPNVIRFEGICWDVVSSGEKVWPVLVFEKARNGDLLTFMGQAEGRSLTIGERLNICADIAIAVSCICIQVVSDERLRSQDNMIDFEKVIHGDIKSKNVLIFENDSSRYVAKVADFGYSTWFTSDDEFVKMPRSQYWVTPEWHRRGFKTADAMKMDIYSFGMLCLWLLFYNTQENTTRDFYSNLNLAETVLVLAHELIIAMAGLDNQRRCNLNQLFNLTLADNPAERSSDFTQLISLLVPHR